ncbi:hypothetical protein GGX14DRAFT_352360, partial [Mycena pura]
AVAGRLRVPTAVARTIALTKSLSVSWVLIDIDAHWHVDHHFWPLRKLAHRRAAHPLTCRGRLPVFIAQRALNSGAHGLMVPATCPQPRMEIRTTERSCHQEIVVQARGPANDAIVVAVQIEHPAGPGPTRYRRSTRQGIDAARDRRGKGSTHATSTFVRRPCAVIACESHNAFARSRTEVPYCFTAEFIDLKLILNLWGQPRTPVIDLGQAVLP